MSRNHVEECPAFEMPAVCRCEQIREDWQSVADEMAYDQMREEGIVHGV